MAGARVIPADERESRTLRRSDCIACKACVGHEPSLVNAGRCFGRIAQILIPRMYVERIFDVGLSPRVVMNFRLDADTLAPFSREHTHFEAKFHNDPGGKTD